VKKTYVFDKKTLEILKNLKEELGKSETQIIKEALRLYHKVLHGEYDEFRCMAEKLAEVSYKLGALEERLRILEEELRRLKRD